MLRVLTVIGTRPEAIKLAPVLLELQRRSTEFSSFVCATGQHRQMLDQVLSVFGIQPDHDLGLMLPGQSLTQITARAVEGLNRVINQQNPDVVLVQGDTTTAFCGALAAHYQKKKVGHVEAGLRTGDKFAPFPEEMNRRLISSLSDYHFAPTNHAKEALLSEGVLPSNIFVTGNTVIDALFLALKKVRAKRPIVLELPEELQPGSARGNGAPRLVLITGHRRENFGEGFESICQSISELGRQFPDIHFVYPVHLNPNVREPVLRVLGAGGRRGGEPLPNIHLLEPLPYLPFVGMLERATLILTDSGGVQEEAPSLGKPVLVMREKTERPEAVQAGTVRLVGTDREKIVSEVSRLLTDPKAYSEMARAHNPYGDGHATERIVAACRSFRPH